MSKARQLADLGGDTANLEDISSVLTSGQLGNRNLIINGAMQVAQRGTSFTNSSASFTYKLDRFVGYNTSGTVTYSQVADAPDDFVYSMKATVDTSSTADQGYFLTTFEGQNMAHLNFGSSSAKDITLSFWVKSSLTGTYNIALRTNSGDATFVKEYNINAANTWEYKTITITGKTDKTWATNNTNWGYLFFSYDFSSAYDDGIDGQWVDGDERGTTNQTRLIGTTGATFQITGVQLEVGDTATPFEHRSYGQELALCQRYYYEITSTDGSGYFLGNAFPASGSEIVTTYKLPSIMRTEPSVVVINQTSIQYRSYNNNVAITGSSYSTEPGKEGKAIWFVSQSGVSSNSGGYIRTNANATSNPPRIIFDAEI
jgi:hypothetical protein